MKCLLEDKSIQEGNMVGRVLFGLTLRPHGP